MHSFLFTVPSSANVLLQTYHLAIFPGAICGPFYHHRWDNVVCICPAQTTDLNKRAKGCPYVVEYRVFQGCRWRSLINLFLIKVKENATELKINTEVSRIFFYLLHQMIKSDSKFKRDLWILIIIRRRRLDNFQFPSQTHCTATFIRYRITALNYSSIRHAVHINYFTKIYICFTFFNDKMMTAL